MAVVTKVVCDYCKKDCTEKDSLSIVGNINTVNTKDNQETVFGVGGGLFGDGHWIKAIDEDRSVKLSEIPVHHFHVSCLGKYVLETINPAQKIGTRG